MKLQRLLDPSRFSQIALTGCVIALIAIAILVTPIPLLADEEVNPKPSQQVPIAIVVEIDKRVAQIAEPIQMKITATAPNGLAVKFSELPAQLGDFEVTNVKDMQDIPAGPDRQWIRHVYLESLISGECEIPGLPISFVDRRGSTHKTGLQTTPTQLITIRSTLEGVEDPTQFRDIKSVVFLPETPQRNNDWILWAAGATVLLLMSTTVFVLVRRKSGLSPTDWALKSIQELKDSPALEEKNAEQIYVRLVGILRTFVYWQFGISAPRLTTDEFLGAMQLDDRLSPDFRAELSELLNLADMIKFAGLSPEGSQLNGVVDQAIQLVKNVPSGETQQPTPRDVQEEMSTGPIEQRLTAEGK